MFRLKLHQSLYSKYSTLTTSTKNSLFKKVSRYTFILLSTGYAGCYIKEYVKPKELSITIPLTKYHNNTKEILDLFKNYQLSDLFNNYLTLTVCNHLSINVITMLNNLLNTLHTFHLSCISNFLTVSTQLTLGLTAFLIKSVVSESILDENFILRMKIFG
jgi:hypothetical protein